MVVLLSIKPEFAYKIFSGTKRYEFRRSIFKREVNKILVYASSPIQRIIGEFEISAILHDEIDRLWSITKGEAGISKEYYRSYFANKEKAFAIEIGAVTLYDTPMPLSAVNVSCAPQSFLYIHEV